MFQEYFEVKDQPEKKSILQNRFIATGITVFFGAALTFSGQTMSIWPVFGSANQLLAALALLALTVWIANLKKGFLFVMIPMIFMFAVTLTALGMLVYQNFLISNYALAVISIMLFALSVLLGVKAYSVLTNGKELIKESI
jgi:carbon starvation protein